MEYAYNINGGSAPIMKKFQVAASNTVVGRPYLVNAASGGTGIVLGTTTGVVDAIGVNVDAAGTYVTAQQSDNSDTARTTTIIVSPGAVYRLLLSGGATENTALSLYTVTTGSSDGLAVTTGTDWTSPEFDEGSVWGYEGANAGKLRKITSTSSTSATVIVAFPYDTAVGDTFLRAPYTPTQTETLQLTTNCTQADASIAVGTGGTWHIVEILNRDISMEGRTNSYVMAMLQDHAFGGNIT